MNVFIILIIPPDGSDIGDIELELTISKVNAENIILEYKRYKTYDGYTFEIFEKFLDLASWRTLCV